MEADGSRAALHQDGNRKKSYLVQRFCMVECGARYGSKGRNGHTHLHLEAESRSTAWRSWNSFTAIRSVTLSATCQPCRYFAMYRITTLDSNGY